jgi:hypothetical protein
MPNYSGCPTIQVTSTSPRGTLSRALESITYYTVRLESVTSKTGIATKQPQMHGEG